MTKRSSTFSFDSVPKLGRSALGVLGLTLAGLLGFELTARAFGHRAGVFDDNDLLCLHWTHADDPNAFVLVGSSRSRAGFSGEVFHKRYPGRPLVNLTSAGLCPFATLQRLAEDESFKGTVLYDVAENCILRDVRTHQQARNEYCDKSFSPGEAFNRWARLQLEPHLVLMHPRVGLDNLATSLWRDKAFPPPDYYVTSAERLNNLDLSETGPALGRERVARLKAEHKRHPPPPPERWLDEARATEQLIARIAARGGRVFVVRFPTTGEFWQMDRVAYPRERYWDAFASFSSAAFIHFQDLPTRGLTCGDQSHLDGRDAPAFTNALLDEMERRAAR